MSNRKVNVALTMLSIFLTIVVVINFTSYKVASTDDKVIYANKYLLNYQVHHQYFVTEGVLIERNNDIFVYDTASIISIYSDDYFKKGDSLVVLIDDLINAEQSGYIKSIVKEEANTTIEVIYTKTYAVEFYLIGNLAQEAQKGDIYEFSINFEYYSFELDFLSVTIGKDGSRLVKGIFQNDLELIIRNKEVKVRKTLRENVYGLFVTEDFLSSEYINGSERSYIYIVDDGVFKKFYVNCENFNNGYYLIFNSALENKLIYRI